MSSSSHRDAGVLLPSEQQMKQLLEIAIDECRRCDEIRKRGGTITLRRDNGRPPRDSEAPTILLSTGVLLPCASSSSTTRASTEAVVRKVVAEHYTGSSSDQQRNKRKRCSGGSSTTPRRKEDVDTKANACKATPQRSAAVPFDNGTFPFKLHMILKQTEHRKFISWAVHGRAWKVHDTEAFTKRVLPQYFPKQTKYASFIRQVNLWGFERINAGPDAGYYYHESFRKNKEMMCREMIRKKSVPRKKDHPDFYEK
uniref:HSF-type DNA-binding domain-containing protein n=1 Tax=Leptocylindrus danicus TaxID=163516 RepID=A0A7S2NQY9_9STRA|mmetsp:Transcript_1013/g.1434  ORF Transcript_1013/g.1434 Transcript_1013/m.1434 type:complete len:255 (+) Transcript_1013:33-797(+)